MEIDEMRNKSEQDLMDHIADLRREQFSLRMQKAQGQNAQTHQFARVRREIARAATILTQKEMGQKQNGAA